MVAFEPGDEGAQVRLVAGAGRGDPGVQLLAVPAGKDLGELGDVRGEGVQVRALGPDAGQAGLLIGIQGSGVAQDPAGDVADGGRRRDGGRRGLALEGPQVGIDGGVAAAVALRGDLPVQLRSQRLRVAPLDILDKRCLHCDCSLTGRRMIDRQADR